MSAPADTSTSNVRTLRRQRPSLEEELFSDADRFDFFQAVRLIEMLNPAQRGLGDRLTPGQEPVHFRGSYSLAFPETSVADLRIPEQRSGSPLMVVTFLGLMGQQGVLPTHYTEWLIRLEREGNQGERFAFRQWLSLFEHRLIALFYRAWKKYRFPSNYNTRTIEGDPDSFTSLLLSLVGLGTPGLRSRLSVPGRTFGLPASSKSLAGVDDIGLLRYTGFFLAHPRCAVGLETFLSDFFDVPVAVEQFQGQWLNLEREQQSRLGDPGVNVELGSNAVIGDRVWSVDCRFRLRVGPLNYRQFEEFLPDPAVEPTRKSIFVFARLVRFYIGMDDDFEVQLVLKSSDVPQLELVEHAGCGPHLGWNTWLIDEPMTTDGSDAIFDDRLLMSA